MRYALPEPIEAFWERPLRLAVIVGLHAALLLTALTMTLKPQVLRTLASMDLRVIEDAQPQHESEKPVAPVPLPRIPQPEIPPLDLPVFTTTAETAESAFSVAPQPAAPVEPAPMAPAPARQEGFVTAARFDADYLHNPTPVYPYSARRNHEEGKVVLLVLVSAQGTTKSLKVHRGSGFRALDEAAMEAVQRWRFVPARRGDEPVEDWVLVPVSFHLNRS